MEVFFTFVENNFFIFVIKIIRYEVCLTTPINDSDVLGNLRILTSLNRYCNQNFSVAFGFKVHLFIIPYDSIMIITFNYSIAKRLNIIS